ncbi:MAG: S9 family peptidase, partial [Propioniciclava sp.]
YWYFSRTTEGLNYPRSCRIRATDRDTLPDVTEPRDDEEVLLDVNVVAADHEFTEIGASAVSPNGRLLAYSVDTTGDERYDLWVKDLRTGDLIDGPVEGIGSDCVWGSDADLFYTRVDDAWRPHQVWRHTVAVAEPDVLVLTEPDARFWMGLESSRDHQWVQIMLASKTTTEVHLVRTTDTTGTPRCVAPRRQGVEYAVEVGPDALWILHNIGAPQFMLSRATFDAAGADDWVTVLAERPDRRLVEVSVYRRHAVVSHRTDGATGILCFDVEGATLQRPRPIGFTDPVHTVMPEDAPDADTDRIRFHDESLTTPPSLWEYRLDTGERRLLKQVEVRDHPVHGRYDPSAYVAERRWVEAEDGTRIPLSVVRRVDTPINRTAPGLLYGYGSYEIPSDPYFDIGRISLLDRGFVFAIAHVRGGGELGRPWYEDGKELAKPNTFTDFIACGRYLITEGFVAADRLAAQGGSAGGLLVGAVANLDPGLFAAIHALVPFVDPVTTILNPDLPLTVMEWEEWGNPVEDPRVYASMCSYSPYENVTPRPYPAILATTSFHDTRVEVTEPAKWIARLQATVTNGPDRPVLLRTEMAGGHGGVSGRYRFWRERAWQQAWIIDQVGGPS